MKKVCSKYLLLIAILIMAAVCIPVKVSAAEQNDTDTSDFRYRVLNEGTSDEGISIAGYSGEDTEITIPDEIDGIPVTEIGFAAFLGRAEFTEITLPESLKVINRLAFCQCSSLTTINIPGNVETIGDNAFADCTSLEEIIIPASVKTIGMQAFSNTGITSITVPATVETIGDKAFAENTKLKSAAFMTGKGISFPECPVIEDVTILDGSTKIDDSQFFDCTSLKSVHLPDTLTEIGEKAFYRCASFSEINIPESVKKIGDSAFYKCASLESVVIPQSVTDIGVQAFSNTGLTSIVIPNALENVGSSAFAYNSKLESVTFADGTTRVPDDIFYQCENLVSATIPDTVTEIGEYSFADCTSLEQADIPEGVTFIGEAVFCNTGLTEVTIPGTVTTIKDFGFQNCANLRKVIMKYGVKDIGVQAFADCPNLIDMEIPDSVESLGEDAFKDSDGVIIDISRKCFNATVSGIVDKEYTGKPVTQDDITVVVNGLTLTKDVDYTVSYENNVEGGEATLYIEGTGKYKGSIKKKFTITGKETPEIIDISDADSRIRIVDFEDTFKYTGKAITQKKMSLYKRTVFMTPGVDYKVTYSNNVNAGRAKMVITGIGAYTGTITKYFSIQIPKNAAYTINGVKYVITNAATDGTGTVAFAGVTNNKTDKTFTSLTVSSAVRIGGVRFKVTRVKAKALSGYTYLKSVFIGDGVKVIEANAFYGCKALETITIGKGIIGIGDKAFCRCTKLTKLVIKSSAIKTFGQYTFTLSGSKPVVYVPKAKLASYKKLIGKSGMTAKAVYRGR